MFPSVICLLGSSGLWSNHNLLGGIPSENWVPGKDLVCYLSSGAILLEERSYNSPLASGQPALGLVSLPWPLSVYSPTLTSFKLTALPLLLSLVLGPRRYGKPVLGTSLSKTIVTVCHLFFFGAFLDLIFVRFYTLRSIYAVIFLQLDVQDSPKWSPATLRSMP
ncbi:hypothetical protein MVEN_01429300 [Mycena venus]|uniref:Uncharacterized protein n=1 Tax=Mycena venus TaxID=2733690 RepID=A0A8H7CSU0_9AGAR|nr:hypothetical protein MVEN_01429300 [Mycena venus]